MRNAILFRSFAGLLAICAFLSAGAALAQDAQAPKQPGEETASPPLSPATESPAAETAKDPQPVTPQGPMPPMPATMPEIVQRNPNGLCVQPPPGVSWQDYDGPFAKTVGIFAQRLERRSVHPPSAPHYKTGVLLCTLQVKDKFKLFVTDSIDPVTFLSAGYNGLIEQAQNSQPSFGQGFEGYGRRVGANLAGSTSSNLFKDFLYPTIFSEDPRFYRLGRGSVKHRILHAAEHSVVAHTQNGGNMFNISEWLGTASTAVLSNTYLPDNKRGAGPVAQAVALSIGNDAGFDILREFWPEIAKKFKLPFRDRNEPANY